MEDKNKLIFINKEEFYDIMETYNNKISGYFKQLLGKTVIILELKYNELNTKYNELNKKHNELKQEHDTLSIDWKNLNISSIKEIKNKNTKIRETSAELDMLKENNKCLLHQLEQYEEKNKMLQKNNNFHLIRIKIVESQLKKIKEENYQLKSEAEYSGFDDNEFENIYDDVAPPSLFYSDN